jgi:hypothetical protein
MSAHNTLKRSLSLTLSETSAIALDKAARTADVHRTGLARAIIDIWLIDFKHMTEAKLTRLQKYREDARGEIDE